MRSFFRDFMRQGILLALLLWSVLQLSAQVPTKCFEIENVLADACSAPEGENEMVRFRVGPGNLNVSDLNVSWPNVANLYLGICQNATTAQTVNTINATIQGCGILIEPTGGVLPAGAKVLLITSENVQPLAHSFVNLNDTLYVIFQCAFNTAGHFANSGSGLRTLIMSFSSPAGCADTVAYDRALLVNIYDSTGGSTASQDGSSIAYAWDGTPTYYNNGCVAPFTPLTANAGNDTTACESAAVQLNGSEQIATGRFWFSTQGSFDDASILNPVFTPTANAVYPLEVILNVYTACDTVADTLLINKFTGSVNAGNDKVICTGQSTQLSGSGSNFYSWTTLAGTFVSTSQNPTVNPSATTAYVLDGAYGALSCPDSDTVTVTVNSKDSIIISAENDSVCIGNSVTLTASGGTSYVWSPDDGTLSDINSASPLATPATSAAYTVRSMGSCADTASVFITAVPQDTIVIVPANASICEGQTVQLTASGGTDYQWMPSTGLSCDDCANPVAAPADSIVYTVISTGFCPSQENIAIDVVSNITITALGDTTILKGTSATLTASGGVNYIWSPSSSLDDAFSQTVVATPLETTAYIVTENNYPCATQDTVIVNVFEKECPDVAMPTAFTPNNDGVNDAFGILNKEEFSSITFSVFNRWGEEVYQTNTFSKWDGSYQESIQPMGTYAYSLTAVCTNGEKITRSGCVTLLK